MFNLKESIFLLIFFTILKSTITKKGTKGSNTSSIPLPTEKPSNDKSSIFANIKKLRESGDCVKGHFFSNNRAVIFYIEVARAVQQCG